MDSKQFAIGMAKVSDYFGDEYDRAQSCQDTAMKALAPKLKTKLIDYLDTYGFVEFSNDFIQCYSSYVLVLRRMTEPEFVAWVETCVKENEPLVSYIKHPGTPDRSVTATDFGGLFD